jgi:hypothetical protein
MPLEDERARRDGVRTSVAITCDRAMGLAYRRQTRPTHPWRLWGVTSAHLNHPQAVTDPDADRYTRWRHREAFSDSADAHVGRLEEKQP